MDRLRHSIDYGKAMPSPLIKEKFSRSKRHGTRPSTVSSLSFLGSERSPRFYEKVVRWFRRKRGKEYNNGGTDQFPAEKHSNVHYKTTVLPLHPAHYNHQISTPISSISNGSSKGLSSLKLAQHTGPGKTLAYHYNYHTHLQFSGSLVSSSAGSEFGSGACSPARSSTPSMSHKLMSSTEHSSPILGGSTGFIRPAPRGQLSSTTSSVSNNSLAAPVATGLPQSHSTAGTAAVNSCRGLSLESGYQSFSTCSSPANSQASPSMHKRDRTSRFRFLAKAFKSVKDKGKSSSVEVPENIPEHDFWCYSMPGHHDDLADGRRRMFQAKTAVFHSAVDEEENECGGLNPPPPESRCDSRASSCINSSVFSGSLSSLPHSDTHEMVAITLGDFRFKYSELEFNTTLVSGAMGGQIHTGKCQVWDVNIHSCCPRDDEEVKSWLADVRRLTQIRHENIVLYMGACVEPPKFAIITSLVNSDSLYNRIIGHGKRLTSAGKLSILRQTANAMSYLHCKGIVHGRLSAHNIFLESTVKVSLLDYAPNLLNLQYLAPELIQTYSLESSNVEKSKEGDVYAFGSVMYQLSSHRLPFDSLPSQAVLYLVGCNGLAEHVSQLNLNASLARMLESCWDQKAESRPSFPTLCSQLLPILTSLGSRRKHSLSEPRCLDQLGRTSVFA